VERCRVYYKGEGGGFPQVQAVVSLVCPCCPWFILALKVFQRYTNHLVWVVCRPMWVSEACQLFLVPCQKSNTPLYPSKCCELGSVPRLLPPSVVLYLDTLLTLARCWECIMDSQDSPQVNTDSQDSPWPKLRGSHHLPPYNILCAWPHDQYPNVILSWDSQVRVLKFPKLGLP
jgi:hypothetical protein